MIIHKPFFLSQTITVKKHMNKDFLIITFKVLSRMQKNFRGSRFEILVMSLIILILIYNSSPLDE